MDAGHATIIPSWVSETRRFGVVLDSDRESGRMGTSKLRTALTVAASAALLGVAGFALSPAQAQQAAADVYRAFAVINCSSGNACAGGVNTGSSFGVLAVASKNNGVDAATKNPSKTRPGRSGVYGHDDSTDGGTANVGVAGFSSNGIGTEGSSNNGTGVKGTSVNSNGVVALSSNSSALFAENTTFGDGVQAISVANDGTNSSTQNNSTLHSGRSGVWGHDDSTDGGHLNVGIAGSSTNGIGISASSSKFVGLNVAGGGIVGQDYPALSIIGTPALDSMIAACPASAGVNPCDSAHAGFVVDGLGGIFTTASINAYGNVDILGQYQVNGNCVAGCSAPRNGQGKAVTRYVPTASMPTVEDFGEAQLVNGEAHVQLSPDFANVVDQRANYLVFVTPEGDTNGVYVTQKTSTGFAVRENRGGRSTVAFQYRIVAKPYGVNGARLPMVETHQARVPALRHHV
jgi:hypothetical protein